MLNAVKEPTDIQTAIKLLHATSRCSWSTVFTPFWDADAYTVANADQNDLQPIDDAYQATELINLAKSLTQFM